MRANEACTACDEYLHVSRESGVVLQTSVSQKIHFHSLSLRKRSELLMHNLLSQKPMWTSDFQTNIPEMELKIWKIT